jgi:hypothetical protein
MSISVAGQLDLFDIGVKKNRREQASTTFSDNMKLPVHRWFRYSAGFSAEVEVLYRGTLSLIFNRKQIKGGQGRTSALRTCFWSLRSKLHAWNTLTPGRGCYPAQGIGGVRSSHGAWPHSGQALGPERGSAEPRKARFFAEQKMRPKAFTPLKGDAAVRS